MPFYITGRVNANEDVEETEADLALLIAEFWTDMFIITRETKKKCGLDTHLHYHFIIKFEKRGGPLPDAQRARIRKWLTQRGYSKHMSSVKVTEDEQKAIYYTLKQQDVVYYTVTDTELQTMLAASKSYNEALVINNWQEHLEEIMKLVSPIKYTREKCLYTIHKYIVDWNKTAKKEHKISFNQLHPGKLFTLFHQIESIILPFEQAHYLLWGDSSSTICNKPLYPAPGMKSEYEDDYDEHV